MVKDEIEFWTTLQFKNIKNIYKISSCGKIVNKITKKELLGCNPSNEKGYVRVTLQNNNGRYFKYFLHRLVIGSFVEFNNKYEVNHIDGNKLNNRLSNLEYIDRLGNAQHAAKFNLYNSCEDHYKALLTNEDVVQICQYIQGGYSNIRICEKMNLDYKKYMIIISSIRNRKSWKNISKNYKWNKELVYKKYSKEDIYSMCEYIHKYNKKPSEILKLFKQYDSKKLNNILKKISQEKIYKSIIIQVKSSTTRES